MAIVIDPDHYTIVHSRCPICMEPVGQAIWLPDVFDDGIVCVEHGLIPEWFLEDYPNLTGAEAVIQLRSLQAMHEIGVIGLNTMRRINDDLDAFLKWERIRRFGWRWSHDAEFRSSCSRTITIGDALLYADSPDSL